MPDRIDDTIDAISKEYWLTGTLESSRQHGSERRQRCISSIAAKLPSFNRKQLDSALSLGVRGHNTPEEKARRRGVRAILLAEATQKGVPLSQLKNLGKRWLSRPKAEIAKGFVNAFPAIEDNGNRAAWSPAHFTDPETVPKRSDGRRAASGAFQFIVHCLPGDTRAKATLSAPSTTLQGWDAISCSVIRQGHTFTHGPYGLILEVPANNVLTTAAVDQNIKNHLGTGMSRHAAAESGLAAVEKKGLLSQHLADLNARFGGIQSPSQCYGTGKNEIVVSGRGLRGELISVIGLFVKTTADYVHYARLPTGTVTSEIETWITQCASSRNLPVIYIH